MAAEERRKQKEQIKILKQQVGLLLIWTTGICWQAFSSFICVSIVPVLTAENAEIQYFLQISKPWFLITLLLSYQCIVAFHN